MKLLLRQGAAYQQKKLTTKARPNCRSRHFRFAESGVLAATRFGRRLISSQLDPRFDSGLHHPQRRERLADVIRHDNVF